MFYYLHEPQRSAPSNDRGSIPLSGWSKDNGMAYCPKRSDFRGSAVFRQDLTGGKQKLGPISKQGDRYLRRILVVGAHSVLRRAKQNPEKYPWLAQLLARRPFKVVAIALANKTARIAWALLASGSHYRAPRLAATCAGSDEGGRRAAAIYTLIETALCRARHNAVYAECRTMPNGSGSNRSLRLICEPSSGLCSGAIRHSLAIYKASRKASSRSLARKRVGFPRSYGLSFARAASFNARWAWR
jgi:hypothetical protein